MRTMPENTGEPTGAPQPQADGLTQGAVAERAGALRPHRVPGAGQTGPEGGRQSRDSWQLGTQETGDGRTRVIETAGEAHAVALGRCGWAGNT